MNHIQTLVNRCQTLIWLITAIWIIALPIIWLSDPSVVASFWGMIIGQEHFMITLTTSVRWLGLVISLLPLGVILYMVGLLMKLFNHYKQLNFFTVVNVRLMRKLGFSLYLWAISNIMFKTLLSLVLTFNNPPNKHLVTVNVSGMDIQSVVIGSVVILLSWIMLEAQKISEDSALIP